MRRIKNRGLNILRNVVTPILGMSMFWPLFRYESFFALLYPLELNATIGSFSISVYTIFLMLLGTVTIAFFAFQQRINRLIASRRIITAIIGASASLGVMIAYGILQAALPTGFIWISALFTIVGFLTIFCAWASYFTEYFCGSSSCKVITVLGCSFFLSYLLFSRHTFIGSIADGWVMAVIGPLGSAFLWLASTPYPILNQTSNIEYTPHRFITPIIVVIVAFLLVGGAVRGIVDLYFPHTTTQFSTHVSTRFLLSLALSAIITIAGICLWFCSRPKVRDHLVQTGKSIVQFIDRPIQRFAIICWIVLSFIFLGGLFSFLIRDNK